MGDGRWCRTDDLGATHQVSARTSGPSTPQTLDLQPVLVDGIAATLFASPTTWIDLVRAGESFRPAFHHRGRMVLGPLLGATAALCPACVGLRLAQAFPHPEIAEALFSKPVLLSDVDERGEVEQAVDRLLRWARELNSTAGAGRHSAFSRHLLPGLASVERHHVLPVPGDNHDHLVKKRFAWGSTKGLARPVDAEELRALHAEPVDALFGPILQMLETNRREEGAPSELLESGVYVGFLDHFLEWAPDVTGSGTSYSPALARGAALGEGMERYCANYPRPKDLRTASYAELVRAGEYVIHPQPDSHIPATDRAAQVFRSYHDDADEQWIRGRRYTDGSEVWALAESVLLNLTRYTRQRPVLPVNLSGVAAGSTSHDATLASIGELVERDATMRWWHGDTEARCIELAGSIVGKLRSSSDDIETWFLELAAEGPYTVVAACLWDTDLQILTTGYAARYSPETALLKASAEVWQSHSLSREFLDRQSRMWRSIDAGKLPVPTLGFRPGRDYATGANVEDMLQLSYNIQYYLDPSLHEGVLARLRPTGTVSWSEFASSTGPDTGRFPPAWDGLAIFDLTTPDARALGYEVVRALAPGLVGNSPAGLVPVRHPRLRELAPLNLDPIPHA